MEDEIKFDLKELYDLEEKNGKKFDYIRFSCADINGISRTNTVPRRHAEHDLVDGFGNFVGRALMSCHGEVPIVKEVVEAKFGNNTHLPCKNTLHKCLWAGKDFKNKKKKWEVAEVLCEMKWPPHYKEGSMVEACPRYALRKQLHSLQQLGFHLMSAFEMEFCMLNPSTLDPFYHSKNSMATLIHSEFEEFCYTLEKSCAAMGIDINASTIESGHSELELVMEPKFGIECSDSAFLMREAVKEIGNSFNYLPTFMCYFRPQCFSPSSAHFNLSLWTEDAQGKRTNAFYDANDPESLSSVFRHFLAGLIKHSRALCVFWCPTVNCYRRFKSFKLPPRADWGFNNRKVTFRIKNDSGSSPYLEIRKPSSACNHYLVTAACLVAGIDGIKQQLPLLPSAENSIENAYLPKSLEEALEALEEDEPLKKGLGEELVRWLVEVKTSAEIEPLKALSEKEKMEKEKFFYLYPF